MSPYNGLSSSGSFASSARGGYRDSKDDVVFQLTERLREREDELQQVCRERDRLEDQLQLRGNLPVHLDVAYEELLAHCKEREEEHKAAAELHQREKVALEKKCEDLEDKLEEQDKAIDRYEQEIGRHEQEIGRYQQEIGRYEKEIDRYEQEISHERDEVENEIRKCHHQLEIAADDVVEKEQDILSLEKMVNRLKSENERLLDREEKHNAIIARISAQVEDMKELEMLNFRLEERLEAREEQLLQKEEDLNNYIQLHEDEMKNMELRLHKVIDLQSKDLQQRDREIIMLKRGIEKYEEILDEADYVTREQRLGLKAREERIGELSMAIERSQNSGLLSRFDKLCTM